MIILALFTIDYVLYQISNILIDQIKILVGLSFTFRYKHIFKIHKDTIYYNLDFFVRNLSQYILLSFYHLNYIGYNNNNDYPLLKILIALTIQDFSYYGFHRLMHTISFYKNYHKDRHQRITTSWAARSGSIFESNVENVILMLPIFLLKMNKFHFHCLFVLSHIWNTLNYESTFRYYLKCIRTPVDHLVHNQFMQYNFALWTVIPDRIFGTYIKI